MGVDVTTKRRRRRARDGELVAVQLVSGGTLTLTVLTAVWDLDPADREFVFGLVDAIKTYERRTAAKADVPT